MKPCNECIPPKTFDPTFKHCPYCGRFIGEKVYNRSQAAEITQDEGDRHKEEGHPSFAQLSFSRRSSSKHSKNTLYGSSVRHGNTISMRIVRSKKVYDKYSENYYGHTLPLIEVEMSQTQFSEAITAMNVGDGVPVTLRSFIGEPMPLCPEWTLRERITEDLNETFKSLSNDLLRYEKRLNDILTKKGTVKVSEKTEIINMYRSLMQEIRSNMPFLKECMDEAIDKSTNQAKGEIEAFWLNKLHQLGMSKLHELTNNEPTNLIGLSDDN